VVMLRQATWRTDEQCPSCDEEMVLLDEDDGDTLTLAECRACGHRETWEGAKLSVTGGGVE
jgi:Zn ribbon nucleic-acid-binding protein